MSNNNEELTDTIVQSIALSIILIEKFDIMLEKGYAVQVLKSSVKTTLNHLNNYVNNLFKVDDKDIIFGADIVLQVQSKIEFALSDKDINIFSDKKKTLEAILLEQGLSEEIVSKVISKVNELKLLTI